VTSVVTITNAGGAPLNITAATLVRNFGGRYNILPGILPGNCTFTTPLAASGACTVRLRYVTPATRPATADVGLINFANDGAGTVNGVTGLGLVAQ
jgi:hypothetical protein